MTWKRVFCWFGRHPWKTADFVVIIDMDYWGPLAYVVACPRCGKRKFWEGE